MTTAASIRAIVDALDLEEVTSHFSEAQYADNVEGFIVCDGVTVDAFNEYVAENETLRIAIRFLSLDVSSGRLYITEYPVSKVHEATAWEISWELLVGAGDAEYIACGGRTTVHQPGLPDKEADATFGPKRNTPALMLPPHQQPFATWFTVVVEVGRWQTWPSLLRAAEWWCRYLGLQYLLLVKISADGTKMRYAVHDIVTPSLTLPPASVEGELTSDPDQPPVMISFDMRRVLGIPADLELPQDVNEVAHVDLRRVMRRVIQSI